MGTITGTNNNDQSLSGTSGNDTINALAGIDWIIGSTGNDRIDGGSGDSDVVMYSSLSAGVIVNNTASQVGNVGALRVLKSGGQQDTLVGIEAVHGTQFADKIYMSNNTYVFAEGGNDEIRVGTSVTVFAGSGNDTIYGGVGSGLDYYESVQILQTRGIVAIWNTATSGIVTDDGWGNTDKFFGIGRISGSVLSDVMTGNIGNDQMSGVAGDDYLYGNGGADSIDGGDGSDMLFGGAGDDYISGGSDDDSIYGGDGNNSLDGGDGNDVYFVQSDVAVYDVIDDAGGDADILQVLDTSERDAYRLVYDGTTLMQETAQGHRTEIALDENGAPVIEYLQWVGTEEYGTDNYTNTLRIITDLSNIYGVLVAVAGTDEADTIVMPNETPQEGELWGDVYANGGDDNVTLSSTLRYWTYAGDGNDSVFGVGAIGDFVDGQAGDDYLEGNGGDDYLYGGAGNDGLNGGDGNDSLSGGDGSNFFNGGNGNDTLIGGANDDFINGGSGNDLIDGGDGGFDNAEYYDAASGITVNKSDGSSGVVTGSSSGTDTFVGIEIVVGSNFNDTFNGSSGDDFFTGDNGNDKFYGGDGFDAVVFEKETGWWRDDAGTHGVIVNMSDYSISVDIKQGSGLQTVAAHSDIDSFGKTDIIYSIEMIFGTKFGDYIAGDAAGNNLQGQEGDDTLNGGGGYDVLAGGDGNDVLTVTGEAFGGTETGSLLYGGEGDDTLISSQASSWGARLTPGLGHNIVYGSVDTWNAGDGDDLVFSDLSDVRGVTVIQGENGTGTAVSGDGRVSDTFEYIQWFELTSENDSIIFSDEEKWKGVAPGAGNDTIIGGAGVDDLYYGGDTGRGVKLDVFSGIAFDPWGGTDHFSGIENFRGSYTADFMSAAGVAFDVFIEGMYGNDVIIGGNGSDRLLGDEGDDRLYGGDGHDVIDGGDGNDWLYGGAGFNQLDGGAGDDTYVYREGINTVTDVSGENWLRFERGENSYISRFYVNNFGSLVVEESTGSSMTILNYRTAIVGINWVPLSNQVGWSEYSMSLTDTSIGTLGADTLQTSSASYVEGYGSDGNDTIYINGTQSSWVSGDGGADIIYGGVGQDTIRGDWNSSASGNDSVYGGFGNDSIKGDGGNDSINGDAGNDTLDGGLGNDILAGGTGNDSLTGGDGIDTASYNGAAAAVTVNLGTTSAQNTVGAGTDTLTSIENLIGSAYNDTLLGDANANSLSGGAGNDSLSGGGGNDTIVGDAGNDTLDGAAGNDSMSGGANDDTYVVDSSSDEVVEAANAGNDLVQSSAATYTLAANVEKLTLVGNAAINGTGNSGDNILTGNSAANSIYGGGGNDTIIGGAGNDTLEGAAGNDSLTGGDGIDTASYNGAAAAVTVNLGTAAAQNTVGAGTDTLLTIENLIGSAYNDTLIGDANANSLSGGSGNDSLTGGAGNDTLEGGAGNDTLTGGDGTDTASYASATGAVTVDLTLASPATGGAGTDTFTSIESLIGSSFNDLLTGTSTVNRLEGGSGADTLVGGAGADLLYGGDGDDRFVVALAADLAGGEIISGDGGADELRFTSTTASTLTLTSGVAVEKVVIGTGTAAAAVATGVVALNVDAALAANGMTIVGNAGANTLTGSGYNDSLDGGLGNDTLLGGNGNDTLVGGGGNDNLTGGANADVFVFNTTLNASSNLDTITDFTSGTDRINLAKSVMAALGTTNSALIADAFWQGAGVVKGHDASDRIVYNTSTGVLYYDADGSGSGAAVQLAQLGTTASHPASLSAADFFVF